VSAGASPGAPAAKRGRHDGLVLPAGIPRVTLGEGDTPLVAVRDALLKCEHVNPTGSYKDRIASVGVSIGVARGAKGWIGTSSGNAGAAYAAYGARAGLNGRLYTVDGVVPDKLAYVMAFGVEVWEVVGFGQDPEVDASVFDAVGRLAAVEQLVVAITANAFNAPSMAGVKEIAWEIVEELGGVPPAVYVPVGGGGLLTSLWEGFDDWRRLGFETRVPRLVGVQPEGCAPIHLAAAAGAEAVAPVDECTTSISGLQITNPPDGDAALAAVRASGGWTQTVTDAAAAGAQALLAREHGIFVEPAAAAAYAAYVAEPTAGAVVLMTGSGLKTLAGRQAEAEHARVSADEVIGLANRHG
jgi:threonine synthase